MNTTHRAASRTALRALCLVLSTSAAAVAQSVQGLPFEAAARSFPTGTNVRLLVDVTGDGHLDAIGVVRTVDTSTVDTFELRLHPGRGDGTFDATPAWTVERTVGGQFPPWSAARGDLDGDGLPDFVVTYRHAVEVFRSTPAGVPAPVWFHVTGTSPAEIRDVEVGDVDGDGLDDLALVSADVLEVWRGTPTGPVLAGAITPSPFVSLALADVDGQPGREFVALRSSDGSLHVFDIVAGALVQVATSPGAGPNLLGPLVAGDVDGDGDDDVLHAGFGSRLYRQTGPGVLTPEFTGGSLPVLERLVDVDGDGDLDGVGPGFVVAVNDGTGRFDEEYHVRVRSSPLADAVDLDGDGDIDLVGGDAVYLDRGAFAAGVDPQPESSTYSGPMWDWEGDGDIDMIRGSGSGGLITVVHVRLNDGTGLVAEFPDETKVPVPAPPTGSSWGTPEYWGDFDGDGDVDVVVRRYDGVAFAQAHLLRNEGGTLADGGPAALPGLSMGDNLYDAVDLDDDGDVDLAVRVDGPSSAKGLHLFLNDGTGVFHLLQTTPEGRIPIAVGDLDDDGRRDYVEQTLIARFRTSIGLFEKPTQLGVSSPPATTSITVGDADGDGATDVVATFPTSNDGVRLYRRDAFGLFTGAVLPDSEDAYAGVDLGDVDGDGTDELVIARRDPDAPGQAVLLDVRRPDGAGGFTRLEQVTTDVRSGRLRDLDGDGDLDLGPPLVRGARFPSGAAGSRRQFGFATAGTGGASPTLGATGPFRVGETMETRLVGGRGGAFAVLLVDGPPVLRPDWPAPGLEGYVGPGAVAFFTLLGGSPDVPGSGSARWPGVIPAGMRDVTITMQAFVQDTAVVPWIVQSNGIEITFR